MSRKLRHPHQATGLSELSPGASYAMVMTWRGSPHIDRADRVMLGEVRDSPRSIASRGGEDVRAFFDLPPGDHPGFLTAHLDGWFSFHRGLSPCEPSLVYWEPSGHRSGWDDIPTFLGEDEEHDGKMHCIVVPSAEWDADPRVHVVDWVNPDDVVRRAAPSVCWADEEARLRAKRDEAMRRACGFD